MRSNRIYKNVTQCPPRCPPRFQLRNCLMKTVLKTDKNYANNLKHIRIKKNNPINIVCSSVCSFIFKTKFANRKIQLSEINVPQMSPKMSPNNTF